MNGEDKGLLDLKGKPLVQHVIDRIAPQADNIIISANRNHARYEKFGYAVVSDEQQNYLGPLAGIAAAMQQSATDYLLVVPCDTPFLPNDLATTLRQRLEQERVRVCLAHDGHRLQPLIVLLACSLRSRLDTAIAADHLKVETWMLAQKHCIARFSDPDRFININSRDELARAETQAY